jgi:hypothetical protein
MKATILPLKIDFSRWCNRNGERSATNPLVENWKENRRCISVF